MPAVAFDFAATPTRPAIPAQFSAQPFTINTALLPVRRHIAALFFLLATAAMAQQPPRPTILLDPAHGGPDPGAHLPNNVLEKDVTLAFAARLRAALAGANFTVIATRDADPSVAFPPDQRAGIANHARPAACILLHATDSGNGVHIVTSALAASSPQRTTPWDTAQSAAIPQSLSLSTELHAAILRARLPVLATRSYARPLDNLTCPAIAVEIAPLDNPGAAPTPVTDAAYQQRIAEAVAKAITAWRDHSAAAPQTGAAQ